MRDTLGTIPGISEIDVDDIRSLATFSLDTEVTTPEKVAEELIIRSRGRYKATVKKIVP